ncbi:MAG: hypothetical protein IPM52_07670 [Bacteroidetes bacterium]|nr:hypothetical protein [Bacteroidota bacterium]
MKTKALTLALLLILPMMQLSAKKKPGYRNSDYKAGNFVLHNGKVYYEKLVSSAVPLSVAADKLGSKNAPQAGIQVKSSDSEAVKGVLIRKTFDWAAMGYKPKKLPLFARLPVNGNFELATTDQGKRIRVTDIWFTNQMKAGAGQHLTLENMVTKKGGFAFRKNKKVMRGLEMLDRGLSETFQIQGSGF